jgi:DNA-binding transcriptional regulator YhcF (GntR family)
MDDGLLEKRRGIGMFVANGARERLLARRRSDFTQHYVEPMLAEAGRLGIDVGLLVTLIRESSQANGSDTPATNSPGSHAQRGITA